MDNTINILILLLNSFIHDKAYFINQDVSWNKVYKYASINNITGIIGYVIYQYYPENINISDGIRDRFINQTLNDFSQMELRYKQGKYVSDVLNNMGVRHVCFKGYTIRDYYPIKQLRLFGDIDFLIGKEDRMQSDKAMREMGFTIKNNWEPSYSYKKSISLIEVHSDLMDSEFSNQLRTRDFYNNHTKQNIIQIKENIYEFKKEFHLVFLITHIAKHCASGGAGIKLYLDLILMIINEENLDWQLIESYIKEIGMWRFASFVFSFIEEYFYVKVPLNYDKVSSEDMSVYVSYIFDGGTFGKYHRTPSAIELSRTKSTRLSLFLKKIFPSAKTIEERYTYLKTFPILLPFAWIHRVYKNIGKVHDRLESSTDIFKVDNEEIEKMKKIAEMLGI